MESAILMTGLTVGGLLAFPLLMEWLRRFQVGLALMATLLLALYAIAPHSASARSIVTAFNQIPQTLLSAASESESGLAKFGSSYFSAFHH